MFTRKCLFCNFYDIYFEDTHGHIISIEHLLFLEKGMNLFFLSFLSFFLPAAAQLTGAVEYINQILAEI